MQISQGAIVLAASIKFNGMAVDQLVDDTHVGAELSDVADCAGFPVACGHDGSPELRECRQCEQ
jgi:hypothetical protein